MYVIDQKKIVKFVAVSYLVLLRSPDDKSPLDDVFPVGRQSINPPPPEPRPINHFSRGGQFLLGADRCWLANMCVNPALALSLGPPLGLQPLSLVVRKKEKKVCE